MTYKRCFGHIQISDFSINTIHLKGIKVKVFKPWNLIFVKTSLATIKNIKICMTNRLKLLLFYKK